MPVTLVAPWEALRKSGKTIALCFLKRLHGKWTLGAKMEPSKWERCALVAVINWLCYWSKPLPQGHTKVGSICLSIVMACAFVVMYYRRIRMNPCWWPTKRGLERNGIKQNCPFALQNITVIIFIITITQHRGKRARAHPCTGGEISGPRTVCGRT